MDVTDASHAEHIPAGRGSVALCDPKLAQELVRGSGETEEFRANTSDAAAKATAIPNMPSLPEIPTPCGDGYRRDLRGIDHA
jgi:hypothetical protein